MPTILLRVHCQLLHLMAGNNLIYSELDKSRERGMKKMYQCK
jgi:hypothetical protein